MKKFGVFAWIFLVALTDVSRCVDVHFENKDGGFFLKHSPRQHYQPTSEINVPPGSLLSIDRFTVFQTSQPISVRATYGPFSTKQTVPARYVVPDPLPLNTSITPTELQDLATHHLDMSAHIVRNEIPRDSPVLRVLFHTGTDPGNRRQLLFSRHHQKVCIVLHATLANRPVLSAACSPDGEDGVCLAQITIPSSWWPPLPPPDKEGRPGKTLKSPPRLVQVAYSLLEPRPSEEDNCQPRIQFQPSTVLGTVPLVQAKAAYKELKLTEGLTMLVPHPPLFPLSRMHIPVFLEREKAKLLTAIVVRGRVKSGIRILNATPSDSSSWNVTVEINPRHTGASVTALRKEPIDPEVDANSAGEVQELFTWLIEVTEDAAELYEGARVVWSMKLEPNQEEGEMPESHRADGKKSTSRLDIQKDDIQAVVPISKNWEVLNTAVLTGRQVSQAMKVLIVSQAGKAADVTFQASCHSEDDSVLKVSSSCSSVYVDGSEARGSVNGSVLVKYGTYTGLARFTVWMPEFPLDLQVFDVRLSQIKSWKVPDYHQSGTKIKRKKRSYNTWGTNSMITDDMGNVLERPSCRLRYQQSPVDVYAHFMASDHDSGRVTYLVNRRTWLRVTDLVLPLLRVSDPRIANLRGRILQGRSMGRTEVQVLSPITGRVIGAKEIRVGNDKTGISRLSVQVVSGLQLNISPDSVNENGYIAETSVTRKLTAQYQEGLLDIELEFSDGSRTPLREVPDTDYHLVVESLDPEVVAFAPMVASHHPRVIAVGEGSGDLLQITLLLPEECRGTTRPKLKGNGPLASAAASVTVDFSASDLPHRPDILQNDGGSYSGSKMGRDFHDLQDILKGTAIRDDDNDEPNVQARQHQGGKGIIRHHAPMNMTPLEISMYVLLAAFCFAIVIFVVSCMVYASKFKPVEPGTHGLTAAPVALNPQKERKPRETTTNAHDWVWLGRATLEHTSNRSSTVNNNPPEIRITTNPLNMNYCDPEDCVPSSFSNPTHIELPSSSAVPPTNASQVDSSTYCKSKPGGGIANSNTTNDELDIWNKPTPPPPLPPHAHPPIPPERHKIQIETAMDEDYRPPVPPHRNIGVTARISSLESPPPRKHHHHHHRGGKHSQDANKYENHPPPAENCKHFNVNEKLDGDCDFKYAEDTENPPKNVFEFDDEPVAISPVENPVKIRHKNLQNGNEDDVQFVHLPHLDTSGNGNRSPKVKRATIVGNPMFSTEDQLTKDDVPAELSGLDELGMDYEQIMHYFDNLKRNVCSRNRMPE
uniref:Transmembrane protein 132E n=1 Tax=Photinus pyralis TaxID=7054 RepID=A0A1Y1MMI2_PHOPY